MLVNNLVICELKIARSIQEVHEVQLYNYLKATEIEVGLILNFGPKAEFKRRVFENSKKGNLDIYSKKINPENPVNPDNPRLN